MSAEMQSEFFSGPASIDTIRRHNSAAIAIQPQRRRLESISDIPDLFILLVCQKHLS